MPIGSIVLFQREDGRPWIRGSITEKGDQNHTDQSYKVCMTKTGQLITETANILKMTPITSEQYLRDQISKDRKTDTLEDII